MDLCLLTADMAHISVERELVRPICVSRASRCTFRGCSKRITGVSLAGVLRLGLNLDVIVSFCLYKIRGVVISRKFALLCSVAAAVVLFKHFGYDT